MINFKKKKRWHCLAGQQPTEMDLKIMEWERKGKLVPTRELVKTPEQIEGIRVAGKINSGCLDAVAEMIRPGISTKDIDNVCVEYCKAHNAISATLGYEAIPRKPVHQHQRGGGAWHSQGTGRFGARRHRQRGYHAGIQRLLWRRLTHVHHRRRDHTRKGAAGPRDQRVPWR